MKKERVDQMNRWSYPIQWAQQKLDEHQVYLENLHKVVDELRAEIKRLDDEKANRAGRRPKLH